jgi:ribonuclease VapC
VTLDSSALIAILFGETGHLKIVDRILHADSVRVGAPTLVETSIVTARRRRVSAIPEIDALLKELDVAVAPFGEREWRAAMDAFGRFGKGRHPAALNFGDCLAYAAASTAHDSLLFTGEDFSKTDIERA